jgi:hypothetical protein
VEGGGDPIRFLSRSLAKAQLNWSTPEKEWFAIWHILQQLSHLLQEVHLVIHTDHEKLNARILHRISEGFLMAYVHASVSDGEDNIIAESSSSLCHDYLHGDESEQTLAREAESLELIAAFLATQDMLEYVSPTTEWVAADVDMDVDVAQEQLQRIPFGSQSLTAETFELIQRAHSYVREIMVCSAHWISYADKASALKVCECW